ncbi:MAG TPA: xanthine dehydrogenase family protein [Rectinemataceae bacterium]|nr:xanthine dehydrogenase family protein [Rectinemataceae bacterium]
MAGKKASEALPLLSSMRFPDMLYASTIRSTAIRAKSLAITRPQLPAGYRCITASDIAEEGIPLVFADDIPLFAESSVAFKGEALGLIVGPDAAICDELARAITVEYEEEEPELEWESFSSSQIGYKYSIDFGNVDATFEKASRIERAVYRNGIFDHHYSEPMGAIANWEYDKMAIYCASQWPEHVRRSVAATMKVPEDDIVVRPTDLGVSLDGRLWFPSIVACQAAIAAKLCRKPVRLLYTREEDFLRTPKQARSAVTIKSASDEQGRLQALDIKLIINIGAYNPLAQELIHQAAAAITGIYYCPSIRLEAYAIKSNIIPLGAMGSIGATHAFFSIESHLNHLAGILGKTPAEIKTHNMLAKGSSNYGNKPLDYEIPFAKIHKKLEKISDYRRKYASYELVKKRDPGCREGIVRGIALTVGYQTGQSFSNQPSMSAYSVETTLDRELNLIINTQASIGSESLKAMWRATAAAALSIQPETIHFSAPNTDTTTPCGPLTLSRGASIVNKLIERTCKAIQKKRFRESLPITAKVQTRVPRTGGLSEGPSPQLDSASWCGTAVEIEIDTVSGDPKPIAVWMVVDAGRIVSKELALASLRASIISALNLCIGADFNPNGNERDEFLRDRSMSLTELPAINIEFLDSEKSAVARGLGELPFITVPAAFYSALTQALGVEPRQLPLEGSEILRLLETT